MEDVARGFAAVVGASRAKALALAWSELYADCIVDAKVVALPETFGVPRLDKRTRTCDASIEIKHAEELTTLHGRRLLRFAPGTLCLLAAANPDVRQRFDRFKIQYGHGTIDDPVKWKQLIDFLKNP